MVGFGELAEVLGCEDDTFPTMYLGLPLGARSLSVPNWERVHEKVAIEVEEKMPACRGRATLLKATLNLIIFFRTFPSRWGYCIDWKKCV